MEELGERGLTVALFEQFPIRRTWHQNEWWFSVIDCMAPLSGSPNPRRYWSDLKKNLLAREGLDVYASGVQSLPLPAQDGRMMKTDCANTETLLRLIQSVPSPNAEPFKAWLAKVGKHALEREGTARELRSYYRHKLQVSDDALHQLVSFRGIVTPEQHQEVTDQGYMGLYENHTEESLREERDIPEGDDIKDYMGAEEEGINIFHRTQARALIERRELAGEAEINQAVYDVGVEVRLTIARLDGTMPEDLPVLPKIRQIGN